MRPARRFGTVAIVVLAAASIQAEGARADSTTGAMTGRVTDIHNNPLPGVYVELDGSQGNVAETQSDAQGRYTFDDVIPGQYGLCFVPLQVDAGSSTTGYLNSCPSRPIYGTVTAGSTLQMPRMSLYQAGAVAGRVIDSAGTPLAGITIAAGRFANDPSTTTDSTGHYRIVGLAAGSYTVCTRPSLTIQGVSQAGYLQGCSGSLTVSNRQTSAVPDLADPSAVGLSGRVTDSTGHPITGVGVMLSLASLTGYTQVTQTDSDGRWSIVDLAPSNTLSVCFTTKTATGGSSATGYQGRCYLDQPGYDLNLRSAATPIDATVPGAITTGIDQKLSDGAELTGRIATLDATPMSGVLVTAQDVDSGATYSASAVSDAHGYYRIPNMYPGTYEVCFLPDIVTLHPNPTGYLEQCYKNQNMPAHSWTAVAVPAGVATKLAAHLVPGAVVTGRITDIAGNPLNGATVGVYSDTFGDTSGFATTAADGTYRVEGLGTGGYNICFTAGPNVTGGISTNGYVPQCWLDRPYGSGRLVQLRQNTVRTGFDAIMKPVT